MDIPENYEDFKLTIPSYAKAFVDILKILKIADIHIEKLQKETVLLHKSINSYKDKFDILEQKFNHLKNNKKISK